jgi:hypothetical protein
MARGRVIVRHSCENRNPAFFTPIFILSPSLFKRRKRGIGAVLPLLLLKRGIEGGVRFQLFTPPDFLKGNS